MKQIGLIEIDSKTHNQARLYDEALVRVWHTDVRANPRLTWMAVIVLTVALAAILHFAVDIAEELISSNGLLVILTVIGSTLAICVYLMFFAMDSLYVLGMDADAGGIWYRGHKVTTKFVKDNWKYLSNPLCRYASAIADASIALNAHLERWNAYVETRTVGTTSATYDDEELYAVLQSRRDALVAHQAKFLFLLADQSAKPQVIGFPELALKVGEAEKAFAPGVSSSAGGPYRSKLEEQSDGLERLRKVLNSAGMPAAKPIEALPPSKVRLEVDDQEEDAQVEREIARSAAHFCCDSSQLVPRPSTGRG